MMNSYDSLKNNLPVILVAVTAVAGYVKVQSEAKEGLRMARESHKWQDDWEKNGQLPDDIRQNNSIKMLNEKVSKIEAMNLEARLVAIETNQENIQTNQQGIKADLKKIDTLILEVRDAVLKKN